ncbi:MAG: HAD family phosphatase [Chloroflexi bacterium]|nr:HAD family phosphatase [Ardenticatenaceae bacterium]MBL1127773.1 HAD family phosphatase [Chloroflexota bacterium]NOG33840.1 HAD family phosphatase [Chloroflexota bacterium]GIK54829.1 MAG: haloacid dehalogenase [Chloroflexota bacterium]
MSNRIKAIIFDFGGVILRTQDWSGRRRWEQRLGLPEHGAEQLVFNSDMGRQAQHGRITTNELWQWVGQTYGLPAVELAQFQADFWAGDVLDRELVAWIRGLRPFYQTALISNAFDDLRDVLTTQFAIADAFDVIVISAEEGIMKPDPRLYQIALERLGCRPEEALFIDDFAHNIAGAQTVGLHTIHFKPGVDLMGEIGRRLSDEQ